MKLTPLQWAWMAAASAFLLSVLLDVFDVLDFPTSMMAASALLLSAAGWLVGPSLKELERQSRRGK